MTGVVMAGAPLATAEAAIIKQVQIVMDEVVAASR